MKDPEARRLAKLIGQETGDSMARVVTEALWERYERLQRRRGRATVEELPVIAAAHVKRPYPDHAKLLYDEHGLPK